MKKCHYRKCRKEISKELNGNLKYCPVVGENLKTGCYYKEKKLRQLEYAKEKQRREKQMIQLRTTLELILADRQSRTITTDRFMKLISDFSQLLERKMIKQSEVYFFEDYLFFKTLKSQETLIEIQKHEKLN